MIFKNGKTYDTLKWIAMVCLPAVTTLWLTVGSIWSIPYTEPIGATLGAITVFLGALLGVSSVQYSKIAQKNKEKK